MKNHSHRGSRSGWAYKVFVCALVAGLSTTLAWAQPAGDATLSLLGQRMATSSSGNVATSRSTPAAPITPDVVWMDMRDGFGYWEFYTLRIDRIANGTGKVHIYRKMPALETVTNLQGALTAAHVNALWTKIEQQGVMALPDNLTAVGKVTDLYTFDVRVVRAGRYHRFKLYGPSPLSESPQDKQGCEITDAILSAANLACPLTAQETRAMQDAY